MSLSRSTLWFSRYGGLKKKSFTTFGGDCTFTEIISDDEDATAIGLNESLTQFGVVALLHLFADVLEPLKKLMIHFQKRDIDLNSVETDYTICLKELQNFTEGNFGPRLKMFFETVKQENQPNKYSYKNIYI